MFTKSDRKDIVPAPVIMTPSSDGDPPRKQARISEKDIAVATVSIKSEIVDSAEHRMPLHNEIGPSTIDNSDRNVIDQIYGIYANKTAPHASQNANDNLHSFEIIHEQRDVMDLLRRIEEQNNTIIQQNNLILIELSKRNNQTDTNSEPATDEDQWKSFFEHPEGFPLSTMDEFDDLNSNSERLRNLYKHLVKIKARKLRDFLYSTVKETLTDELLNKFTWLGDANHKMFGETEISRVFFRAAHNCKSFFGPEDVSDYKREMLEVFRVVKQRLRNSKKRPPKAQIDQSKWFEDIHESSKSMNDENRQNSIDSTEYS